MYKEINKEGKALSCKRSPQNTCRRNVGNKKSKREATVQWRLNQAGVVNDAKTGR